ncbi:MAG: hypothetical protein E7458_03030 [Ruminococcaceae bacterium]|nr:hypothetical protein [Oscillospiraceae bacterium]
MRRFMAVCLALLVLLSLQVPSHAVNREAETAAETLYQKGLFRGTGTDPSAPPVFELERVPSRTEAITMLVRLLGAEEEALSGAWPMPFRDVEDWARPYVGYAYAHGLTAGTSAAAYGGDAPVTAAQYLTFMLRVLGYESGRDFAWDRAWDFADEIGLTDGRYTAANDAAFTRGDAAIVSLALYERQQSGVSAGTAEWTHEDVMTRTLDDAAIAKLQRIALPRLKDAISTYGDFAAWAAGQTAEYRRESGDRSGAGVLFDAALQYVFTEEYLCSNMLAALAVYCLEDDYEGIGILAGLAYDEQWQGVLAGNYIPVAGGYLVLPAGGAAELSRRHGTESMTFRAGSVERLADAAALLPSGWDLGQLWQISTSDSRYFAFSKGALLPEERADTRLLYENPEAALRRTSLDQSTFGFATPAETATALTPASGLALSRGSIDQAAAEVNTMADFFAYLYYSGFHAYGSDLYLDDRESGLNWHFNCLPERVFADNAGNCGGTAGLAAYLLDGDYDEVGLIGITFAAGEGGGHVINYVRDGGRYYVFDPVNLVSGGFDARGLNLQSAATLEAAAEKWAARSHWTEKLMMAYESTTGDSPVGWGETNVTFMFQNDKANMRILLETESQGYQFVLQSGKDDLRAAIEAARARGKSGVYDPN